MSVTESLIHDLNRVGGQIAVCDTKVAFRKMSLALCSASKIRGCNGPALQPYRCPICDEWHLTSKGAA